MKKCGEVSIDEVYCITIDRDEVIRTYVSSPSFKKIGVDEALIIPILTYSIEYGYTNIDFLGNPEDAVGLLKEAVGIPIEIDDRLVMAAEKELLEFFVSYIKEASGVRLRSWSSEPGVDSWRITVLEVEDE